MKKYRFSRVKLVNCIKKINVQLSHIEHIKYWEIMGPVLSGVFTTEAQNIISDQEKHLGFFFKQGKQVIFDPYAVERHSVIYYNISCKICKTARWVRNPYIGRLHFFLFNFILVPKATGLLNHAT